MDSRRQRSQRSPDPLDRRLDRWLDTGRQLVDGVSGARPGRRSLERLDGVSRLDAVGRWVGDRIDWLLDEEDDWSEASDQPQRWQPPRTGRFDSQATVDQSAASRRKRPLQALSRRQPVLPPPTVPPSPSMTSDQDVWPEDDNFKVERWKRSERRDAVADTTPSPTPRSPSRRPLPRSSRRRD
jgi:hypothetical protein